MKTGTEFRILQILNSFSSQESSFVTYIRGLSGKYSTILNILTTVRVALAYLGIQSEETLLCIREQSLSRGASQSAVRRR